MCVEHGYVESKKLQATSSPEHSSSPKQETLQISEEEIVSIFLRGTLLTISEPKLQILRTMCVCIFFLRNIFVIDHSDLGPL